MTDVNQDSVNTDGVVEVTMNENNDTKQTIITDAEGNVIIKKSGPANICPSDPGDDTQCEACQ